MALAMAVSLKISIRPTQNIHSANSSAEALKVLLRLEKICTFTRLRFCTIAQLHENTFLFFFRDSAG